MAVGFSFSVSVCTSGGAAAVLRERERERERERGRRFLRVLNIGESAIGICVVMIIIIICNYQ